MAKPFSHPLWSLWQAQRQKQLMAGKFCACLFLCSMLALIDGLQTLVRTDTDEILLLAGESDGISGPCPLQNPVSTDLEVRFQPQTTLLRFELEGFFAGYLIGNGMWRGQIIAPKEQGTCDVNLIVAFKGSPKGQKFRIHVFANEDDLRAQSPSLVLRYLGFKAFAVSGIFAVCALLPALFNVFLGRKNLQLLQEMRLAEIFRVQRKTTDQGESLFLWCTAKGGESLTNGKLLPVYSTQGELLGKASIVSKEKQIFCLSMAEAVSVSSGCLVHLLHKDGSL